MQRGVVMESLEASGMNDNNVSNVFCSRTADTSNITLNERLMYLWLIFRNV